MEEPYQKPFASANIKSRSAHHIYALLMPSQVSDIPTTKVALIFLIFICPVYKFSSLFLLTCLMLKSNLVTCVSPGCARIPLKRNVIAVTQSFGAGVALSKSLHTPYKFKNCNL